MYSAHVLCYTVAYISLRVIYVLAAFLILIVNRVEIPLRVDLINTKYWSAADYSLWLLDCMWCRSLTAVILVQLLTENGLLELSHVITPNWVIVYQEWINHLLEFIVFRAIHVTAFISWEVFFGPYLWQQKTYEVLIVRILLLLKALQILKVEDEWCGHFCLQH